MNDSIQTEKPLLVFKYGGNAMVDDDLKKHVLQSMCSAKKSGFDIVIVHGGGPFIKEALSAAKIESEFIDGHRKTTPEAFEYVEMALKGKVNGNLVGLINSLGYTAVGLSGKDGGTAIASRRNHQTIIDGKLLPVDLGHVGDVVEVNPSLLRLLLHHEYIPVITCLAADPDGISYNINGDMFAGHIAAALHAAQYIILTDVDGLLRDKDDVSTLIDEIAVSEIDTLINRNIIQGGMIPKIESCRIALAGGAAEARIINGTKPDQIVDLLNRQAVGTAVIHKKQAGTTT